MEIHQLESDVVDKIAAGEVVDRPAHMVKELVENAIDAGATRIELSVSDGGRTLSIKDNGRGVFAEDLPKVFLRHATSKISSSDDLWQLTTFGFRGEALASIGSVSRMQIKSRRTDANDSYQIHCDFGKVAETLPSSGSPGTSIEVKDLFENIPARKKFLKSDSAEVTQIKNVLKAMALSHPHVEWKIKVNDKLLHVWHQAKSLLERAQQVLAQPKMYYCQGTHEDFEVEIAFCDPGTTARVSRQIWLFVQGRWVQDRSLQASVMEAYRNLLMHGEYPYCVVKLKTNPEHVDVNIHPTKSQIKFLNQKDAFRAVHYVLREELEAAPWLEVTSPQKTNITAIAPPEENLSFKESGFAKTQYNSKSDFTTYSKSASDKAQSQYSTSAIETIRPTISDLQNAAPPTQNYWGDLQVLGQLNLTYIIAQDGQSLRLIDQHAAHERVVFEQLMMGWREQKLEQQTFLLPLNVDLEESEADYLMDSVEDLAKMGIGLERAGPCTLSIASAPAIIRESALVKAIEKMSGELVRQGGSFAVEKVVADIFATLSCHSVVRAGQALSTDEMQTLLRDMDQFPLSGYCPHGRSVSVEKSFFELEKEFGRRG